MIDPVKAWAWIAAPVRGLGCIVKSMLTGADGSSWAPGRIMGLAVFVIGQCLVMRASAQMLARPMDPNNWTVFFQGVAVFEGSICAVAIGLVLGMAPADAGGGFWKAAAPEKVGQ